MVSIRSAAPGSACSYPANSRDVGNGPWYDTETSCLCGWFLLLIGYDIHSTAHIIAHPLPIALQRFAIFPKTGIEIGNGDESLAVYGKGGHKTIKKRPRFALFQCSIVHGLTIIFFAGFCKVPGNAGFEQSKEGKPSTSLGFSLGLKPGVVRGSPCFHAFKLSIAG
jgi:hypothetical protein